MFNMRSTSEAEIFLSLPSQFSISLVIPSRIVFDWIDLYGLRRLAIEDAFCCSKESYCICWLSRDFLFVIAALSLLIQLMTFFSDDGSSVVSSADLTTSSGEEEP